MKIIFFLIFHFTVLNRFSRFLEKIQFQQKKSILKKIFLENIEIFHYLYFFEHSFDQKIIFKVFLIMHKKNESQIIFYH